MCCKVLDNNLHYTYIVNLRSTCACTYVTSYICSIIITVPYNLLQKHLEYQETENETFKLEIEQLRKSSKVHTYVLSSC